MKSVRYEVEIYSDDNDQSPFLDWLKKVSPVDERRIRKRILRIEDGNLGDYKSVGDGVFELRFFFGSGYRVYFGFNGETVVLLLSGGDKSTQSKDVSKAKKIWKEAHNG
ncbi:type II toxin-antitoxin system RelE/ParE family toxin [bacterium]|nr:type II toxin-antitoxin system RelE/ParE family toxin [bacterium]